MLQFMITYIVAFLIFYILLALYEKYIKVFDITNVERIIYVCLASLVWPITIFGLIIFAIVKIVNSFKKF